MGMKLAPNERLVAALVTKETKAILKAMADSEGISMSQLLREMIDRCLKEILDHDNR
jgi:predicted DNA-binding protein